MHKYSFKFPIYIYKRQITNEMYILLTFSSSILLLAILPIARVK